MFVFNSFSLDFSKFVQFIYLVEFRLRVSKFKADVYSFTRAFNACWEYPMLEEYHGVLLYETICPSILMKGQTQTDAIFLNCFISNKQLFVTEIKPGMPDSV